MFQRTRTQHLKGRQSWFAKLIGLQVVSLGRLAACLAQLSAELQNQFNRRQSEKEWLGRGPAQAPHGRYHVTNFELQTSIVHVLSTLGQSLARRSSKPYLPRNLGLPEDKLHWGCGGCLAPVRTRSQVITGACVGTLLSNSSSTSFPGLLAGECG